MSEHDRIKTELGSTLKTLRTKKGMTKKDVHLALGLSTREISRIERGEYSPTFVNAVRLINLYGGSLSDIARLFDIQYGEADVSYDLSSNHRKRLGQYLSEEYCCYFISTQDIKNPKIDKMTIRTKSNTEEGYLSAIAEHNGYEYDVKIVSPMEYNYTFFYMTSKGNLRDRPILILPFIREIRQKFVAGVGIMLSFSTNGSSIPCFQKVMIFSENKYWGDMRRISDQCTPGKYLTLGCSSSMGNEYIMMMKSLVDDTKSFYAVCQGNKAKQK